MRPYVVVEVYHAGDSLFGILIVGKEFLMVNPLGLKDAVHALSDGIVGGIVAFCHADSDVVFDKGVNISIAGILRPTVGMVYGGAKVPVFS